MSAAHAGVRHEEQTHFFDCDSRSGIGLDLAGVCRSLWADRRNARRKPWRQFEQHRRPRRIWRQPSWFAGLGQQTDFQSSHQSRGPGDERRFRRQGAAQDTKSGASTASKASTLHQLRLTLTAPSVATASNAATAAAASAKPSASANLAAGADQTVSAGSSHCLRGRRRIARARNTRPPRRRATQRQAPRSN